MSPGTIFDLSRAVRVAMVQLCFSLLSSFFVCFGNPKYLNAPWT